MTPYEEGVQASKDNKPMHTCPYKEGDDRRNDWIAGWRKQAGSNKPSL